MAAGYYLSLTPAFQSNYQIYNDFGFRITITASLPSALLLAVPSNVNNASPSTSAISVFRYVLKPASPDGTIESVFSGVCSWPDYTELPTGAPFPSSLPANYRTSSIDLVVESETVANEIWILVQQQVTQLMQTIADGQTLTTAGVVQCASQ